MTFKPKTWTGLGLGLVMLGTAGLAACSGEDGEHGATTETVEAGESGEHGEVGEGGESGEHGETGEHGESGEHSETGEGGESGEHGEGGEAGEGGEGGEAGEAASLSLPHRLAFMSGHVEAGLALYKAGEAEMASKHLLHPVSETHAAEREGLDQLGFQANLFEEVSVALDQGKSADEIKPQLAAAEANLAAVTAAAAGDTKDVLEFLLQTISDEYAVGVPADTISDAGEYQDAYGFAVVARQRATSLEGPAGRAVREQLDELITLWPNGPVPVETPPSASAIAGQVGLIRLELSGVQ